LADRIGIGSDRRLAGVPHTLDNRIR